MSDTADGDHPDHAGTAGPTARPRRSARLALALALFGAGGAAGIALKLAHDGAHTASLAFAHRAQEANDAGDYPKALLWALAGLPQPGELWGPDSAVARAQMLRAYTGIDLPRTLEGHTDAVLKASFSPDGKTILTASQDGTVKLWDAKTGKLRRTLPTPQRRAVRDAAFDPAGARVIAAADDTARIWDVETGRLLTVLEWPNASIWQVAFDPTGTRVLTRPLGNTVRLWDARTGALLHTLKVHTFAVYDAAFSPDGSRVVTGSGDGTARIWDAGTGQPLLTLSGSANTIGGAASAWNGRAETASRNRAARLWKVSQDYTTAALDVTFGPSNARVATAHLNGTARLWNARTGELLCVFSGHGTKVRRVAFGPMGKRLVTLSQDGLVRIWDPETCRLVRTLIESRSSPLSALLYSFGYDASFDPGGTRLLTSSGGNFAYLWDVKTGMLLKKFAGHGAGVFSARFSPDGKQVVTASEDRTARVWGVKPVHLLKVLKGHDVERVIENLAFDPSGKRLVTPSWDRTARLWNAQTGALQQVLSGHEEGLRNAAFSGSGNRVITTLNDGTARVWNAESGKLVQTIRGENEELIKAVLNETGTRALLRSSDNSAELWDVETGRKLRSIRGANPDHVFLVPAAAFPPEGPRVFTPSGLGDPEGKGTLWDAESGQPILVLRGHWVSGLFSPSGTHLVTTADDDAARIWEAGTGKPVMTLKLPWTSVNLTYLDWANRRLLASILSELQVWDLQTGKMRHRLNVFGAVEAGRFVGKTDYVFVAPAIWDMRTGTAVADFTPKPAKVHRAAINRQGTRMATVTEKYNAEFTGGFHVGLWEVPPILHAAPAEQIRMACERARRIGVTEFSEAEMQDPILRGRARNPCNRRGLLSAALYKNTVQEWIGKRAGPKP